MLVRAWKVDMSDKASTIEDTTKVARVAVIAALGSIHEAERELLGAREALVGALDTLERMHKPFVFTRELDRASPPDATEKHGDILVDGVTIDFDRQVAPTEPTDGATEPTEPAVLGKASTSGAGTRSTTATTKSSRPALK
jgi:BRCT domain type II-containing protein